MRSALTTIRYVDTKSQEEVVIIQFCGAIQGESGNRIFDEIDCFAHEQPLITKYLFDFADVTTLDSRAICNLIYFFQKLKDDQKALVIARPDTEISAILDNVGVSKAIEIYSHIEEAKAALCGSFVY